MKKEGSVYRTRKLFNLLRERKDQGRLLIQGITSVIWEKGTLLMQ
jgi:hypothetical protein